MYAITGITGNVGGIVARALLNAGHAVRAVIRDPSKGAMWETLGCDVSLADMNDAAALATAFKAASGVFVLLPPNFDPSPGFPEARAIVAAVRQALEAARPGKVVCLSTIGAQATRQNLLNQLDHHGGIARRCAHAGLVPAAGWFMENCSLGRRSGA